MLWIYLIILQVLFFAGLLFFLRHVLTRNISKATGRLRALSKDFVSKEEEAKRLVLNAQKEAKGILVKETQAAKEARAKIIKEANDQSENILQEAKQKGEEIAEKAQKNSDFVLNEINQRIDDRAKEKVSTLIHQVIPKEFLQTVHQQWMDEFDNVDFNLMHLKLPEKIKEAKVISAFALTDQQQNSLKKKLKKNIKADVVLKTEIDPSLIAGFVIAIGSVVVDASLKHKIQKAM